MIHRRSIFLLVTSLLLVSAGISTDTTSPEWRNLQDNVTEYVVPGEAVNVSGVFRDNGSGLGQAVLATNETGEWKNYTLRHIAKDGFEDGDYTSDFDWVEKDPEDIGQVSTDNPFQGSYSYKILEYGNYQANLSRNFSGLSVGEYQEVRIAKEGDSIDLAFKLNFENGDRLELDYDSFKYIDASAGKTFNTQVTGSMQNDGDYYRARITRAATKEYRGVWVAPNETVLYNTSIGVNISSPSTKLTKIKLSPGFFGNEGVFYVDDFTRQNLSQTYESPVNYSDQVDSFELADFTWQNSSFTGDLGYKLWSEDNANNWRSTETQSFAVNQVPAILSTSLNWTDIGGNPERRLQYSISDPDGDQISSHNSPPSGSEEKFTNTSYVVDGVGFPFDYTAKVTDFVGAVASSSTDISTTDTGYQERTAYDHSIDSQRIERTAGITNNGDSINYALSMGGMGTVVQGDSWSGSLDPGNSISKTSIWEEDYVTGETEETYSKYGDGDYDHTEDVQRLHNRTKLLADNSRSFIFHNVDISSICSRTSTSNISAASGFLVTDDCNRPSFTGDWISETVSQEYPDSSYSHTLDTQKIEKNKTLSEDGGYSWSQVAISPPTIPGECTDCSTRTRDLSSLGSVEEVYHATSDWITGETLGTYNKYSDADFSHGQDTQRIHNRTELLVDNTRSFEFHSVEISGKCNQSSSASISTGTGVRVTDDCTRPVFQVDVINESTSSLFEDTGYSHSLSSQGVAKSKTLSETRGYDFIGVNVSAPALPGSVQNGGMREINLSSDEASKEIYNSTGDWILEDEHQHKVGQNLSQIQTVDQQFLFNQTELQVNNTRDVSFSSVDVSGTCSVTESAAVPEGDSVVTESCNNESFSGDWIRNEENQSTQFALR